VRETPPPASAMMRRARENAGLSQEIVARRIGMSLNSYRELETVREPSVARLRQFADALGLTLEIHLRP
jgi:transcriptional regulator with XRE-family HTH domain